MPPTVKPNSLKPKETIMALGTITFHNIKSIVVTPNHFESKNIHGNIKSMEFILTDDKDTQFAFTVYGDLSGKNTMPDISFAPTKTYQV